jgi:hypothetical protein
MWVIFGLMYQEKSGNPGLNVAAANSAESWWPSLSVQDGGRSDKDSLPAKDKRTRSGTDVMIFKIFSPKKSAKIGVFDSKTTVLNPAKSGS